MAVNVTTARRDLYKLIDQANDDQEAVEITTRRGSAFLVPEETYRSMVETLFLLRSRTNARRLLEAVEEVERGEVVERELPDLEDLEDEDDSPSRTDVEAVRAWARENGFEVLAREEVPEAARTAADEKTSARA